MSSLDIVNVGTATSITPTAQDTQYRQLLLSDHPSTVALLQSCLFVTRRRDVSLQLILLHVQWQCPPPESFIPALYIYSTNHIVKSGSGSREANFDQFRGVSGRCFTLSQLTRTPKVPHRNLQPPMGLSVCMLRVLTEERDTKILRIFFFLII
jgi:hypothetical protein